VYLALQCLVSVPFLQIARGHKAARRWSPS
jgi:hypothetical protein